MTDVAKDEGFLLIVKADIKVDHEAFVKFATELCAATSKNEVCFLYEWFVTEDKKQLQIIEHYKSSAAFMSHMKETMPSFREQLGESIAATELTAYGNPSEEIKEMMKPMGLVVYEKVAGLTK